MKKKTNFMAALVLLVLSILAGCREESTYPDYFFALVCALGAAWFIVMDAAASRDAGADDAGETPAGRS